MPIKNYTTRLDTAKIVGTISAALGSKGARSITTHYNSNGSPDGIGFVLVLGDTPISFRLPCNVSGVEQAIRKDDKKHRAPRTPEHFQAVAWAIVRDWVEAQLALVEAGQATLTQVFLPYSVQRSEGGVDVTLYDVFMEQVQKQLPAGGNRELPR